MGDVINFPGINERSWHDLGPQIQDILRDAGAPAACAEWVCADLKPRFLAIQAEQRLSIPAPPNCERAVNAAVDACAKFFHGVTDRVLLELVKLELELWGAKLGGAHGT